MTNNEISTKKFEIPINAINNTTTNDIKILLKGVHAFNISIKETDNNKGKATFDLRTNKQLDANLSSKLEKIQKKISKIGLQLKEINNLVPQKEKSDLQPISIRWDSKPFHINKNSLNTNFHLCTNSNKESEGNTLGKKYYRKK